MDKYTSKVCSCKCQCGKDKTSDSKKKGRASDKSFTNTDQEKIAGLLERLQTSVASHTEDKKHDDAKQQALALKNSMLAEWTDALNHRRRGYWNYILNKNKRSLYQEWQNEDPSFLPLKFRPKISNSTDQQVRELRIEGAHDCYRRNIDEMKIYEEKHKKKFLEVDHSIENSIQNATSDKLIAQFTKQLWTNDTKEQEARSLQIWNKKERFLRRKKHEETSHYYSSQSVTSYDNSAPEDDLTC